MKKSVFILAVLFLFLFSACKSKETQNLFNQTIELTALSFKEDKIVINNKVIACNQELLKVMQETIAKQAYEEGYACGEYVKQRGEDDLENWQNCPFDAYMKNARAFGQAHPNWGLKTIPIEAKEGVEEGRIYWDSGRYATERISKLNKRVGHFICTQDFYDFVQDWTYSGMSEKGTFDALNSIKKQEIVVTEDINQIILTQTQVVSVEGNKPAISAQEFQEVLKTTPIFTKLPESTSIIFSFWDAKGNMRDDLVFNIKDNGVVTFGRVENPDIEISTGDYYLDEFKKSDNLCPLLTKIRINKDVRIKRNIEVYKISWKYKALLPYKDCIGL